MDDRDWLAQQFEENRTHLRSVAYRMLGSLSEADDALQEAWLHLSRSEKSSAEAAAEVPEIRLSHLIASEEHAHEPEQGQVVRVLADREADLAHRGGDGVEIPLLRDSTISLSAATKEGSRVRVRPWSSRGLLEAEKRLFRAVGMCHAPPHGD
jgi:Sigma-70 region 2